jgi:hypothetical protein
MEVEHLIVHDWCSPFESLTVYGMSTYGTPEDGVYRPRRSSLLPCNTLQRRVYPIIIQYYLRNDQWICLCLNFWCIQYACFLAVATKHFSWSRQSHFGAKNSSTSLNMSSIASCTDWEGSALTKAHTTSCSWVRSTSMAVDWFHSTSERSITRGQTASYGTSEKAHIRYGTLQCDTSLFFWSVIE